MRSNVSVITVLNCVPVFPSSENEIQSKKWNLVWSVCNETKCETKKKKIRAKQVQNLRNQTETHEKKEEIKIRIKIAFLLSTLIKKREKKGDNKPRKV